MSLKEIQLALKLMGVMGMYEKFHRALQIIKNDSPIFTAAKNVLDMPELANDINGVFIDGVLVLTRATAATYAEIFSKRDLKKLIKFYKSDVGKKFVGHSSYIEEKVMNASTSWMTESITEISSIVLSYSNEINNLKDKMESAVPASTKLH